MLTQYLFDYEQHCAKTGVASIGDAQQRAKRAYDAWLNDESDETKRVRARVTPLGIFPVFSLHGDCDHSMSTVYRILPPFRRIYLT